VEFRLILLKFHVFVEKIKEHQEVLKGGGKKSMKKGDQMKSRGSRGDLVWFLLMLLC